ncbi:hypothetical protein D9611_000656 [Ephemerocybe angulata]|uniref:Uncharacterized protein n=1 Tax=Ephemerocybe angulata TaxID=980116 RepID=A0A8H5F740_9AGAR|nr:hypothetical protein D9611_000656 [Tulosesus angulatus]
MHAMSNRKAQAAQISEMGMRGYGSKDGTNHPSILDELPASVKSREGRLECEYKDAHTIQGHTAPPLRTPTSCMDKPQDSRLRSQTATISHCWIDVHAHSADDSIHGAPSTRSPRPPTIPGVVDTPIHPTTSTHIRPRSSPNASTPVLEFSARLGLEVANVTKRKVYRSNRDPTSNPGKATHTPSVSGTVLSVWKVVTTAAGDGLFTNDKVINAFYA